MFEVVASNWVPYPVEVPIHSSGKRASARNPYTICKGCGEFMEVTHRAMGELEPETRLDKWHDECFKYYYEQESEEQGERISTGGTLKHNRRSGVNA